MDLSKTDKEDWVEFCTILVDPKQTPIRLDRYLLDKLEKISRNRIQNAIKAEAVLINDKGVKSSYKVRPNDFIRCFLPKSNEDRELAFPEDIPLDIRYEDDDLLIVHKPPGMVVHPGIGNWSGTLVNGLAYYLKGQELPVMQGNSLDRPGLVHRIDKDTSGLLVIAKKADTLTHLGKQFFDHKINRKYIALVWGEPNPYEGTITGYLSRSEKNRLRMELLQEEGKGKYSVTHYHAIEPLYYVSLVECTLETGRTHQIRAHMKAKGNPVFNDERYGGDSIRKGTVFTKYKQFVDNCFKILPRQGLHAASLGFIHPASKKEMFFEAPLPEDMRLCVEKWRAYLDSRKE